MKQAIKIYCIAATAILFFSSAAIAQIDQPSSPGEGYGTGSIYRRGRSGGAIQMHRVRVFESATPPRNPVSSAKPSIVPTSPVRLPEKADDADELAAIVDDIYFYHSPNAEGIAAYTSEEVGRVFRESFNAVVADLPLDDLGKVADRNLVVIGTPENNRMIERFIGTGFLEAESHIQGYSMRCGKNPWNAEKWILVIAGTDESGALYGLRDFEHYEASNLTRDDQTLTAKPFRRRDYPRIEHRGHWVWGCNMPDKKAWLENMSRWKLNELIHWDNRPPARAKEYVRFAHSRGIRVIWGFGWGWEPTWNFVLPPQFERGVGPGVQMCGSSEFNRRFLQREILRKVRDVYVPTGCDGIYFQSFTEVNKCRCENCAKKTKGELLVELVNPIVDAIKSEHPDLWISCGVHANLGNYAALKDLDPHCNIYWENCNSGVSIRGEGEDFGYINKKLPYGHGFSRTCPADPGYTETSLQRWMSSNAARYRVGNRIDQHYRYMSGLQSWGRNFLAKPSTRKHATVVADHSVFCRRTPFMHVALAEAQWNPELPTKDVVDSLAEVLQLDLSE